MRNSGRALIVLLVGIALAACGGIEDKDGQSVKVGEQYVMTSDGLEHVPFLKDRLGNRVEPGKQYLMTPAGLEAIPYLRDRSGDEVRIGNEYMMTDGGLKLIGTKKISGTVSDYAGKPLPGIEVVMAGTDHKTITGLDGTFSLPFVEGYVKLSVSPSGIPAWCGPPDSESVFLTLASHPTGWDVGVMSLPCILASATGDRQSWSTVDGIYIDNGDGTVTDTQNHLMWESEVTEHNISWEKAAEYAESLITGGYSDWRLPTPQELATLHQTNVACGWHGLALIKGVVTLWSSQREEASGAYAFNVCMGKIRKATDPDWNGGVGPSVLAVRNQ